jgi:hypothetical protein
MSELKHAYHVAQLTSDEYSIPKGSIGIVMKSLGSSDLEEAYEVQWIEHGGLSAPVWGRDLEQIREIFMPIIVPDGYAKIEDMHEPQPGVMHPVDQAFYELVVKERDYERRLVERLKDELVQLRSSAYTTAPGRIRINRILESLPR